MSVDKSGEGDAELTKILKSYWYYSFEIKPGIFSKGNQHRNTLLTRDLLRRIDPQGAKCLDIGTMEGLIPTLLQRRGAAYVAACDRFDYRQKIELVKAAFDVDWDYLPGTSIVELQQKLQHQLPLDVVIFSGVLYHMMDPLVGLARIRGLVHPGSVVVVETLAVIEDSMAMYFNDQQHFYPHSTYFAPSLPCLEAFLRMVGLNPIDCVWFDHDLPTKQRFCRVGVTCRAGSIPLLADTSLPNWVLKNEQVNFKDFAPLGRFTATEGKMVACNASDGMRRRQGTDTIELYATVLNLPEFKIDMDKIPLRLSDHY